MFEILSTERPTHNDLASLAAQLGRIAVEEAEYNDGAGLGDGGSIRTPFSPQSPQPTPPMPPTPPTPPKPTPPTPLRVGARVRLVSLHAQPELNGALGKIVGGLTVKDRKPVTVEDKTLALKPENMARVWVDGTLAPLRPDAPSLVERMGYKLPDVLPLIFVRL